MFVSNYLKTVELEVACFYSPVLLTFSVFLRCSENCYLQSTAELSNCCLDLWPILITQLKWYPVVLG